MSRFHFRGFISMLLTLSFLVAAVTGVVLWVAHSPEILGLGKGAWKHTHIFVSLLMVVAAGIHLSLNWSVFCSYLWEQAAKRLNRKWELVAAVIFVGALTGMAMVTGPDDTKRMAAMSLEQIAQKSGKPVDQIVSVLKLSGIDVHNPADSIQEIAEHNKQGPGPVLAVLRREMPEVLASLRGGPPGPGGPGPK